MSDWGMPCLVVPNVRQAINFYVKAFNFSLKDYSPNELAAEPLHARLVYRNQIFFITQEGIEDREQLAPMTTDQLSPAWFCLSCEDVDKFYHHAISAGAKGRREPSNMSWGERMCTLVDMAGYRWSFCETLFDTPLE